MGCSCDCDVQSSADLSRKRLKPNYPREACGTDEIRALSKLARGSTASRTSTIPPSPPCFVSVENKGLMFFNFPKCSKTGKLAGLLPVCVENAGVSTHSSQTRACICHPLVPAWRGHSRSDSRKSQRAAAVARLGGAQMEKLHSRGTELSVSSVEGLPDWSK